jgi:colanic acid/amylovoran biosynthesis protein
MGFNSLARISALPFKFLLKKHPDYDEENLIEKTMKDAKFVLDISGYGINSQSINIKYSTISYLLQIKLAKKYNVPFYILPQSLGPFDYKLLHKIMFFPFIKLYFQYPEIIFPREVDGKESLKKFTTENVIRSYDIVLQTEQYKINNILKNSYDSKIDYKLLNNGVAIIPNKNLFSFSNTEEIYNIYYKIISKLLELNKKVFIIRHSNGDKEFCKNLKEKFSNNKNIYLFNEEYYPFELEKMISKLDYVISSRYHGLVHAYKNNKPCLVLGWAIKYQRLMEDFKQDDFCFDCRNSLEEKKIIKSLEKLDENFENHSKIIEEKLEDIQKNNIFNLHL